ncbi:MAG: hypothetical protein NZU63_03020 [Gemmataceae bacterium]|nr:hypothetical protein [Gemmataceae bacterium]MDW8241839.1 hypothetical protein [Thermogemmata sp.]
MSWEPTAASPPCSSANGLATEWAVRYEICCSFLIATLVWHTPPHRLRSRWQRLGYGIAYSLLCLLLGPWGLPWGLVYTVRAIAVNLLGGLRQRPMSHLCATEATEPSVSQAA